MKDHSERYAKSAAKQRAWWANMTPAERAEHMRKQRAGMARYRDGRPEQPGPSNTNAKNTPTEHK